MTRLEAALAAMAVARPAETETICQAMLAADPADQSALLLLGLAIGAQGDVVRAQPLLVHVAHLRAKGADARYEAAATHIRVCCRPLVAALFGECLLRDPDDDRLRYCLAEFLHEGHDLQAAMDVLGEGLRRHPDWPGANLLLGIVFADLGRFGAAISQFRRVVTLVPEEAAGWANLGAMLKVEGRFDAALKAYDRAVALAPDNARIRVNRTIALLRAGHLREAWSDFEWRLALPEHQGLRVGRPMPVLSQLAELNGRTVLVTHEEGFGDTLQFMRYLPLLAARGARVLVWVPRPLERVLPSVDGVAQVLSGDLPLPPFDFHCPFVSLPRIFATSLATIPCAVPYLTVDPVLATTWTTRLPKHGLRVGLAWAGQGRPHLPGFDVVDARRSMRLATLAPLGAVEGARFVSLQYGPAAQQAVDPPSGLYLTDPMGEVADFADTAAIIANLDVVVSVDTAVVHLAGAMGKPTLLLDRYDNCWRWFSGRMDSPWYPSLRIFRQKRLDEWAPVVNRVAAALRQMVRDRAAAADNPSPARECRDAA